MNLDWTGSNDDDHSGFNVGTRPAVAIATFDSSGSASFVNGCEESSQPAHVEDALATMIGARADPGFEYGRFFAGVVHELRVYNRTLTTAEILSLSAEMGKEWNVSAADAT